MRSIEFIKGKLEALGYFVGVKGHNLLSVGKPLGPIEGYAEISLLDLYCFISLEKSDIYLILHGDKNFQQQVEISTDPEVINWIKKQYPLH